MVAKRETFRFALARVAVVLLLMLGVATSAHAQTSVSVDINKAKLAWDWAIGTGGTPTEFRVKCGQTSGTYTKITSVGPTLRELSVAQAIAGQGNWFCVVTAANTFGESAPTSELPFAAGAVPSGATNFRLQSNPVP